MGIIEVKSMKAKLITFIMAVCLLFSLCSCKSKTPESEGPINVETGTAAETGSENETETEKAAGSDEDSTDEPEEFKDAPDILIPSEGEEVESMEAQESGVIELEESENGSL